MSRMQEYKSQIDNGDRTEVERVIAKAKDDSDMGYIEKQQLLGYAHFKIDSFEDAIIYMRNAMAKLREMKKHDRDVDKDYMSNSLGDFLAGVYYGMSETTEATGCGGCCSVVCVFCGACCMCDCFWEEVAPESDCCIIRNCAPGCSNWYANCMAGCMDNCCTAPIIACTDCCF